MTGWRFLVYIDIVRSPSWGAGCETYVLIWRSFCLNGNALATYRPSPRGLWVALDCPQSPSGALTWSVIPVLALELGLGVGGVITVLVLGR